jgi:metallo-beta-lactamase family protein
MSSTAKITFCGGAGTVTGSNFLFEADGKKILVDCGLTQGLKLADDINWSPFTYDPKEVDMLLITHAHIDHIGRIPKLIHDGFQGKIYSTLPTRALSLPMLEDTMNILSESRHFNLGKIYTEGNLRKAFTSWQGLEYHHELKITENLTASFYNTGHILGSAMVLFTYNGKRILFTGDLGNSPSPLLPDYEKMTGIDYLVMESVYGDRNHESRNDRQRFLEQAFEDNYKKKGTLIIPVFSLERSQELLLELNSLVENHRIPEMPIFLDSPLAIRLTEVFKQYKNYFNESAQKVMGQDAHLFDFPGLRLTMRAEESRMINEVPPPKVVIAGSGMSLGGRIVHHERHYLPDPNNTLLLLGYQAVGSPGRLLQEGVRTVSITGEYVKVKADVRTIFGYSGHMDSDGLLRFVEDTGETVKKVFVVMGEPKSAMFLVQKLRDNLGISAQAPEQDESVEFPC